MTILVAYLTQNNHALLPVVGAGLCSLLLGIVFVIFLPMLIENYYQNHWGMCIAYTSVGSVYILVETIVAATIISSQNSTITPNSLYEEIKKTNDAVG